MSWWHRHRLELVAKTYAPPVPSISHAVGPDTKAALMGCTSFVWACAEDGCAYRAVTVALGKEVASVRLSECTAALPLVDTREQRDEAAIDLRGPLLRKLSVEGSGSYSAPHATRLVRVDAVGRGPLCGADLRGRPESKPSVAGYELYEGFDLMGRVRLEPGIGIDPQQAEWSLVDLPSGQVLATCRTSRQLGNALASWKDAESQEQRRLRAGIEQAYADERSALDFLPEPS